MAETVIKIISSHWKGWSWSSNTLTTWYKEPAHWKRPWCWEWLRAGEGGDKMRWLDDITDSVDMILSREAWHTAARGSQRVRHNLATKQQQELHYAIWVILGALWCYPRTLFSSFPALHPQCQQLCAQVRSPNLLWLQTWLLRLQAAPSEEEEKVWSFAWF